MKVYADHAATTQLDGEAFEAMKPFLLGEFGNASQPYSFSRTARTALKNARERIANCINAEPTEIYFTSGGTESDNWAIKSTALYTDSNSSIITSQIEHHAVLRACSAMKQLGVNIDYLPVNNYGVVNPNDLSNVIDSNAKLVSIMFSNNEIGTIEPIKELCLIAHDRGALFHTDAVQAIGHIPIDVKCLDVDMLSASAHKFNGPKGVGFLYIKKGITVFPYIDGGDQESGMRAGTENVASIVAMSVALENSCKRIANTTAHLNELESSFINHLKSANLDFVKNGYSKKVPGNISVSFAGAEGEMLMHRLDLMGISVSTGSACDSVNTRISHVLEAINVPHKYAKGTIRISLGYENTEEEVAYIASCLAKILKSN